MCRCPGSDEATPLYGEVAAAEAPRCAWQSYGSRRGRVPLAADRRLDRWRDPPSTIRQLRRHTFSGMDETQTLALQALRELLYNPERDDWDELLAANRALTKAIETGEPMTRRNARIVAEYLREAGWQEHAIGAATAQASACADFREAG